MSTNMGGDVPKKDIEDTVTALKQRFDFDIDAYENGKPVKNYIDAVPLWNTYHNNQTWQTDRWANHIEMGGRFRGTFEEFLDCFDRRSRIAIQQMRSHERTGWLHGFACLFPYHHLAITDDYHIGRVQGLRQGLEEMGYDVFAERMFNGHNYNQETKKGRIGLLALLRNPALKMARAYDARAQNIIDTLALQLSRETKALRFGIYSPKPRKKGDFTPAELYSQEFVETEESKRRLHRVKKLVDFEFAEMNEGLEAMCKGLPLARAIGITSRVETSQGVMHIPMIDFYGENCYPEMTLDSIGKRGMIIRSGKSFHFYGFDLMEEEEWKEFMLRLKERGESYSGVDKYWPDLQLEQGYSMLRITPMKTKLYQPCFVKFYSPEKAEWVGARTVSVPRAAKREKVAA